LGIFRKHVFAAENWKSNNAAGADSLPPDRTDEGTRSIYMRALHPKIANDPDELYVFFGNWKFPDPKEQLGSLSSGTPAGSGRRRAHRAGGRARAFSLQARSEPVI
jgi:hypothetical protein